MLLLRLGAIREQWRMLLHMLFLRLKAMQEQWRMSRATSSLLLAEPNRNRQQGPRQQGPARGIRNRQQGPRQHQQRG